MGQTNALLPDFPIRPLGCLGLEAISSFSKVRTPCLGAGGIWVGGRWGAFLLCVCGGGGLCFFFVFFFFWGGGG